jgi:hypothetical protein
LPKFFNTSEKVHINDYQLDMWPGYTCAVKCLIDGFFLNIDTSTKFLQSMTVLDLLAKLKNERYSEKEILDKLCPKYDE